MNIRRIRDGMQEQETQATGWLWQCGIVHKPRHKIQVVSSSKSDHPTMWPASDLSDLALLLTTLTAAEIHIQWQAAYCLLLLTTALGHVIFGNRNSQKGLGPGPDGGPPAICGPQNGQKRIPGGNYCITGGSSSSDARL